MDQEKIRATATEVGQGDGQPVVGEAVKSILTVPGGVVSHSGDGSRRGVR
jgi:hypothetical protein